LVGLVERALRVAEPIAAHARPRCRVDGAPEGIRVDLVLLLSEDRLHVEEGALALLLALAALRQRGKLLERARAIVAEGRAAAAAFSPSPAPSASAAAPASGAVGGLGFRHSSSRCESHGAVPCGAARTAPSGSSAPVQPG
ncbi:MAG: hypothetical protein VXW27_10020, partial [Pseudomonadota bacterium]|nr:hypothetical protein [Pseudomonadota bacterium]